MDNKSKSATIDVGRCGLKISNKNNLNVKIAHLNIIILMVRN